MKSLFNLDNPFMQILSRIADMMFINILTILCSLPVITIGAAFTANHKVMQNIVMEEEKPLFRSYFHSFRINFKQATIVWLFLLLFMSSVVCSLILITAHFEGTFATILYLCIGILALLVVGVCSYLFPLIARYDNTLREHLHNATLLVIMKMHKTLLLLVLNGVPLILFLISTRLFLDSLIIWVLVGFSLMIYLCNYFLKPVFVGLENSQKAAAACAEDEADTLSTEA